MATPLTANEREEMKRDLLCMESAIPSSIEAILQAHMHRLIESDEAREQRIAKLEAQIATIIPAIKKERDSWTDPIAVQALNDLLAIVTHCNPK